MVANLISMNVTHQKKRLAALALIAAMLTACQTYRYEDDWPAELPDRELFIQDYL